MRAYRWTG